MLTSGRVARRLYLFFFLSGGSGLIYQIIWVREFGNVFGNTIYSASLVIAVFMLGLGVGSYLAGRWADKRHAGSIRATLSLVGAYGLAELAIGVLGLLLSMILPRLGELSASLSWYTRAANGWYVLSAGSHLARYAVAVVLLTPATLLMGATLTLLIRHAIQRDLAPSGWRIAALYGVNTAGAAAGCFLTDYAFVPALGLARTQILAVALNMIAGAGALHLARRGPGRLRRGTIENLRAEDSPRSAGPELDSGTRAPFKNRTASGASPSLRREEHSVLLLTGLAIFLSGFGALGIEILWFRHMGMLLGDYRPVISLVLTVILLGICLGAIAGGALSRRFGNPETYYILAQAAFIVLSLAGIATADVGRITDSLVHAKDAFFASSGWRRSAIELWLNSKPLLREIGLPAFFMGFSYPLANTMIQRVEGAVGRRAGALYLANTVGAVLGSMAAGFVLLPTLGLQRSVTAMAVVLALGLMPIAAASLVGRTAFLGSRTAGEGKDTPGRDATSKVQASREERAAGRERGSGAVSTTGSRLAARLSVLVAGAAVVGALAFWLRLPSDHLFRRTLRLHPGEKTLAVAEGVHETVTVTELPGGARTIWTNGYSVAATSRLAQRYMRAFAHVPLLSMDAPERVLVICFGVGNTAHAASLHPSVRRLDVVDLAREVLEQAHWFSATNGEVLEDPRVSVFVNDGRHHLLMQPLGTYDLITLEPPPIAFAGVAALYSREFYALARSRLKSNGYMTQWLPVYQVDAVTTLSMVRAFIDAFPRCVLLSAGHNDLILVGTRGETLEIDPRRILDRMGRTPAVSEDLERIDLATLTEFIGTFAGSGETLRRSTKDARPLTDDRPVLEYASRSRLWDHSIPGALFDVEQVSSWCPACFEGDSPAPGLEDLRPYLALLGSFYKSPAFLRYTWPPLPELRRLPISLDPETRRMMAKIPYLSHNFREPRAAPP